MLWVCTKRSQQTIMSVMHHFCGVLLIEISSTSEVAELCVRVSCKFFRELNHIFNSPVWSISSSVVYIYSLEFDVKGRHVESVKTDYIPTNLINFRNIFLFLFSARLCLTVRSSRRGKRDFLNRTI